MKAVIMCGGAGTRLRPLTENTPKPMLKLMNRPLIDITLERLTDAGIGDISLALGYRAYDLICFCENEKAPVSLGYYEEAVPLGTAGGVKNCVRQSEEDILAVSGDVVFDFELSSILRAHRESGADITIVGARTGDPRRFGAAVTEKDGRVTAFDESPDWETVRGDLVYTGICVLKGHVLGMIPEGRHYDFASELFPEALKDGLDVRCFPAEGYWRDLDEPSDYREANEELLRLPVPFFSYRGRMYTADTVLDNNTRILSPCLIAQDAAFAENCVIGPGCVIGSGTVFGSGCTAAGCVIGSGCFVSRSSELRGVLLSDAVRIGENAAAENGAVLGYGAQIGRFSRLLPDTKLWPGVKAEPEAVVSGELFFAGSASFTFEPSGVSGRIASQVGFDDAVRIGQAAASLKNVGKIGVACGSSGTAELFRDCCAAGIRSCAAACYDFGTVFESQIFFYACRCETDLFIYVAVSEDEVSFSLYSRCGLPLSHPVSRAFADNYRYRAFVFPEDGRNGELYRMELFSSVYRAALRKLISPFPKGTAVRVECENPVLNAVLSELFPKNERTEGEIIQLLFNRAGSDVYLTEGGRIYSSTTMLSFLCETEFVRGRDVLLPEEAPSFLDLLAEKYGVSVRRLPEEHPETETEISQDVFLDALWAFDPVFLAVKLLSVAFSAGLTPVRLLEERREYFLQKKTCEFSGDPMALRRKMRAAFGDSPEQGAYYTLNGRKGTARVRQLGNSNRLKILAEAADMETAREITAEVMDKIASQY